MIGDAAAWVDPLRRRIFLRDGSGGIAGAGAGGSCPKNIRRVKARFAELEFAARIVRRFYRVRSWTALPRGWCNSAAKSVFRQLMGDCSAGTQINQFDDAYGATWASGE